MIYGVAQNEEACEVHKTHSPITVINERHHPFPQEWQRSIWGQIRDNRTVVICATGHNSVHAAINHYEKYGEFPKWCIGATRDLAGRAFELRAAAQS